MVSLNAFNLLAAPVPSTGLLLYLDPGTGSGLFSVIIEKHNDGILRR